ncbi:MAG: ABC transporter permease, partial [Longimicrobiales bacterium]
MRWLRRGARGRDGEGLREIDEELRLHIEGRTQELIAAGLSPSAARGRALEAFGDFDAVRGEMREIEARLAWRRGAGAVLAESWRDVRIGARRLRRTPGHAIVAILTLALGIGASVAMFTVLNAVVLRPLPYPDSDRLVRLWPGESYNIALSRSVGESLSSAASYTAIAHWGLTLEGVGDATVLGTTVVDVEYFDVFGVRPVLGRRFTFEETEPAGSDVVLLSHELWQSRFSGDPDVIGQRFRFIGYAHEDREVIGVLPPGHQPPSGERADLWIPLHLAAGRGVTADSSWYVNEVVARLEPGATIEEADAEMRALAAGLRDEYPGLIESESIAAASAIALRDSLVGGATITLWLLLGAVGPVLLIACGNLANLLLARAAGRRRETAVQIALGASRGRLVRQQLAESAVIAAAGAALGVVLARLMLAVVRVAETSGLPRVTELPIDARVIGFAAAVTVGTLVVFGLLPALRAATSDPRADLHGASRGRSHGRGTHRLNRALLAVELAMAMTLATAAGLVLSSFATLRGVD